MYRDEFIFLSLKILFFNEKLLSSKSIHPLQVTTSRETNKNVSKVG